MTRHTSITIERVLELAEADDSLGICHSCGADAEGVEPDAEQYTCDACGAAQVYGAEQWILMFA